MKARERGIDHVVVWGSVRVARLTAEGTRCTVFVHVHADWSLHPMFSDLSCVCVFLSQQSLIGDTSRTNRQWIVVRRHFAQLSGEPSHLVSMCEFLTSMIVCRGCVLVFVHAQRQQKRMWTGWAHLLHFTCVYLHLLSLLNVCR